MSLTKNKRFFFLHKSGVCMHVCICNELKNLLSYFLLNLECRFIFEYSSTFVRLNINYFEIKHFNKIILPNRLLTIEQCLLINRY